MTDKTGKKTCSCGESNNGWCKEYDVKASGCPVFRKGSDTLDAAPDYEKMWNELAETIEDSWRIVTDGTIDSEEREDAAISPLLLVRIQRFKYLGEEGIPLEQVAKELGMERPED